MDFALLGPLEICVDGTPVKLGRRQERCLLALLLLEAHLGRNRLAAEPVAVDRLLTRCAGLPLALAIVAAHRAASPTAR